MAISEPTTIEDWVPDDSLGNRLVVLRNQLRLTIEEAAKACGIPPATWGTWEAGTKPRDLMGVVESVHEGLGVNRTWLLFGASGQNWKILNPCDEAWTPEVITNDSPVVPMSLPFDRHLEPVPDPVP